MALIAVDPDDGNRFDARCLGGSCYLYRCCEVLPKVQDDAMASDIYDYATIASRDLSRVVTD
jgi:hypothetical protein